jgi:glycosyltransferase involved in cell wall biosynthesis
MPLYNSELFLQQAIESIQSQTFSNWELIIIDDASVDSSVELARAFEMEDTRIKVFSNKKNQGAAVARNIGIELAVGRFIAFLDSDDLWASDKLELQLKFMENNNASLCYGYYQLMGESGKILNKVKKPPMMLTFSTMLKKNHIGCLTAMYDTKTLGKRYMPDIRKRQDYAMWLMILKCIPYAVCIPEVIGYYRQRKNSISSNKIDMLRYNYSVFHDLLNLSPLKSVYYVGWNVLNKFFGE